MAELTGGGEILEGDGENIMVEVEGPEEIVDDLIAVFDMPDFMEEGGRSGVLAMDESASSTPSGVAAQDWMRELTEPEFVWRNRDDMADFVDSTKNVNTKRKTRQVMKTFTDWLKDNCMETRPIETIEPDELDQFISNYLINKKPRKGGEHQPDTLTSIHKAILRYLKDKNYPVDPMFDDRFKMSREVLSSKRSKLKSDGYGNRPNAAEGFDDEEISKFWACGALGSATPTNLQNTVYFYCTIGFGLRGVDESRQMKWGDVQLIAPKSENELAFIQFQERSSKTRHGQIGGHVRAFPPKIYAKPGDDRCPVAFYRLFASKRPQKAMHVDSPFYLTCKQGTEMTDEICYLHTPMGLNTLRQIVSKMCSQAKIVGKHSNHSLRKTTCQKLMGANVPPVLVAQLTGHKNLASLANYSMASKPQQRAMSNILTGLACGYEPTSAISSVKPDKHTPLSNAVTTVPTPGSDGPNAVKSLSENISGMFSGANVNGPITVNINYNVHTSSQANVNMSPRLAVCGKDDQVLV